MNVILNMRDIGGFSGLTDDMVYVGRRRNTNEHFGNPYTFNVRDSSHCIMTTSREECITFYEEWITNGTFGGLSLYKGKLGDINRRRQWILDNLHTLYGKDLVCWCAPQACHADVLLHLVNSSL